MAAILAVDAVGMLLLHDERFSQVLGAQILSMSLLFDAARYIAVEILSRSGGGIQDHHGD